MTRPGRPCRLSCETILRVDSRADSFIKLSPVYCRPLPAESPLLPAPFAWLHGRRFRSLFPILSTLSSRQKRRRTICRPWHPARTAGARSLINSHHKTQNMELSLLDWLQPETIIVYGGLTLLLVIVFAETGLFFGFFLPGTRCCLLRDSSPILRTSTHRCGC